MLAVELLFWVVEVVWFAFEALKDTAEVLRRIRRRQPGSQEMRGMQPGIK